VTDPHTPPTCPPHDPAGLTCRRCGTPLPTFRSPLGPLARWLLGLPPDPGTQRDYALARKASQ